MTPLVAPPLSSSSRPKPPPRPPRSRPALGSISVPLEKTRLGTAQKRLSPFFFDRTASASGTNQNDTPDRFPNAPPAHRSLGPTTEARSSEGDDLISPLRLDWFPMRPAENRARSQTSPAAMLPPAPEAAVAVATSAFTESLNLNPTRSRFVSQSTSLGQGRASLIGKAADGPMAESHRNDRALVDALTASPIRFDFPSARQSLTLVPLAVQTSLLGHEQVEDEEEVVPKVAKSRKARRRDRKQPQLPVPPKSAPAKPVEWLPPVQSYLYEPPFSSNTVLRDVLKAADRRQSGYSSSASGSVHPTEPTTPPFDFLEGRFSNGYVYVSPPLTPVPQTARPHFLRRLFSSRSLKEASQSATQTISRATEQPPLPRALQQPVSPSPPRSPTSPHPVVPPGLTRALSASITDYTPVGTNRTPANRLRKRKPAPTSIRESSRSIIARGGSLPLVELDSDGRRPVRSGTGSSKGSKASRSASVGSRSEGGGSARFGQGFGTGEESPEVLPPVPAPLIAPLPLETRPELVQQGSSARRVSTLRLMNASPVRLSDESLNPRSGGVPVEPGPSAELVSNQVYPASSGLFNVLGFASAQPVDPNGSPTARRRLRKESASTKASAEKVSRWLGTVTPLASATPLSGSPASLSSELFSRRQSRLRDSDELPVRPGNPMALTPNTATAAASASEEVASDDSEYDQTPNKQKSHKRGKLRSLMTNEHFQLAPAPPPRKRSIRSAAESPSAESTPPRETSLSSIRYIVEPHPAPPPAPLTDLPTRSFIRRTPPARANEYLATPQPSHPSSRVVSTDGSTLTRGDSLTSFTTSSSADERLFFKRAATSSYEHAEGYSVEAPPERQEVLSREPSGASAYSVESARRGVRRTGSLLRMRASRTDKDWEMVPGVGPGVLRS